MALSEDKRAWLLDASARAARHIGYVGAGTMEFLVDGSGDIWFMEMNTRLQVEHPVTEMRTEVDLVVEQLRVAAGHPLGIRQPDVQLRGHAIECRINAEDPDRGFLPSPGLITTWATPPATESLRIETHVESGYTVPPHYDSLLCKVIAAGDNREAATANLIAALKQITCEGVATTIPMLIAVLTSPAFRESTYTTQAIPGWTASPKRDS